MNYRYGRRAADDALPPRMLEPARDGEPEGIAIDFEKMKAAFYELMGLDPEKGIPRREILETYQMAAEAELVWNP